MKLRSVYNKILPALIFALLTSAFSACGFSEDETAARPAQVDESVDDISVGESSTAPTLPEAGVNIGGRSIDNPKLFYSKARETADALDAREFRSIVYTKAGTGDNSVTESVNMHVTVSGESTEKPLLHAKGNVKSGNEVVPLEIYFSDGIMYSSGKAGSIKTPTTFEETISQVDVLYELKQAMTPDTITEIECSENADGTVVISLCFETELGGHSVSGTDELLVNANGIIISEGISLSSGGDGTLPVGQSVEYSLITYGEDVAPIKLPDFSKY